MVQHQDRRVSEGSGRCLENGVHLDGAAVSGKSDRQQVAVDGHPAPRIGEPVQVTRARVAVVEHRAGGVRVAVVRRFLSWP